MKFTEALEWSLTAETVLHRIHPWSKLVGLMTTIFASMLLYDPLSIAVLSVPYLIGCLLARIPVRILTRLSVPSIAFLGAVLLLMLPSGVPGREVLLYAVRGATDLLAILVTTLTTPFNALWSALVVVFPPTLAETGLIFHRSVYRALEELEGTLNAIRIRGWRLKSINVLGAVIATLLIRSHQSAELVQVSVEVRGAKGRVRPLKRFEFMRVDFGWLAMVFCSVVLSGVI
ncbi:CbiQ family ECF transporter T component [Methanopyrus sp. KOL6]|uniref:CbiQ family ECF transporter T component n=1 Tax=Methanopyrus sp. KOL6 TaxID=1937004 RepID=UPI0012F7A982|nr:CbiQ family ECF transporter T component [Methanopyrus sp. KOL6]